MDRKTFAHLDQYCEAVNAREAMRERRAIGQRVQRPTAGGIEWPLPRPVRGYTPNQLKELRKGHEALTPKAPEASRVVGPIDAAAVAEKNWSASK